MCEAIICEKARLCKVTFARDTPGSSAAEFKASKGWFDNFKKRTGINIVGRHGEAASSNKNAAEKYVEGFKDLWTEREQVFNCDETGFFWKGPKRTYMTREGKASFYGICLTFQAVISLHYNFLFLFWLMYV